MRWELDNAGLPLARLQPGGWRMLCVTCAVTARHIYPFRTSFWQAPISALPYYSAVISAFPAGSSRREMFRPVKEIGYAGTSIARLCRSGKSPGDEYLLRWSNSPGMCWMTHTARLTQFEIG